MGDVNNPRIWAGAEVLKAPQETAAPTSPTASTAGWDSLGLLSEDGGITETREEEVTDHFVQGPDEVLLARTTRTRHKRTFSFVVAEDNAVVFGLINPGSTVETDGGLTTREVKAPQVAPASYLIRQKDGDVARQLHIHKGEVTEVGDVETPPGAIAVKEVTVTVYPTDDGVLYTELTNDPQAEEEGS